MLSKTCHDCLRVLPLKEFRSSKSSTDGKARCCKECGSKRGPGNYPQPSAVERFWASVTPAGKHSCWIWHGTLHKDTGYGRLCVDNKDMGAHRFSYELHYGPILLTDLFVCHTCDNPACVNPSHLFLGTQKDNLRDMISKGRYYSGPRIWGEKHPRHRFTENDVLEIRRLLTLQTLSRSRIAAMYQVSHAAIYSIWKRRTWKHI